MTHRILALGRQFGSGGREIALLCAQELGIPCYDWDLMIWRPAGEGWNTGGWSPLTSGGKIRCFMRQSMAEITM